jgi:hypothetical protein
MTPSRAAAAAGPETSWPKALRILEATKEATKEATREATKETPGLPHAWPTSSSGRLLRAAGGHLKAAWKWIESKRSLQIASRRLRVAETISLGEKRSISILAVDGAQYLIGSSSGGVQLLTRLDDVAAVPCHSGQDGFQSRERAS